MGRERPSREVELEELNRWGKGEPVPSIAAEFGISRTSVLRTVLRYRIWGADRGANLRPSEVSFRKRPLVKI